MDRVLLLLQRLRPRSQRGGLLEGGSSVRRRLMAHLRDNDGVEREAITSLRRDMEALRQ